MRYGFKDTDWEEAKREAKEILADRARMRDVISYSDLVARINAINFDPHEFAFFHFLGEISREEADAGRGMMTALVVHKAADMQPGPGFYELAQELGRDVRDITACWVQESRIVYAAWAPQ